MQLRHFDEVHEDREAKLSNSGDEVVNGKTDTDFQSADDFQTPRKNPRTARVDIGTPDAGMPPTKALTYYFFYCGSS